MFNSFKSKDYFDFIKIHKIFFTISLVAIFISFASFFVNKLNFGVDFTGGLLFDITVKSNENIAKLRSDFLNSDIKDFNIQSYGDSGFIIRVSDNQKDKNTNEVLDTTKSTENIKNIINTSFEESVTYNKVDFVGPQVGKELIIKGTIALLLSLIVMLIYITVRFELDFGLGTVIGLLHDVIIIFGIYSIFKIEFDLTSIAAILTVVGYSINDKVVIYDRIREFMVKYKKENFSTIINTSLTTTLRRTLLTSSTTLVSLLILSLIGGESVKDFSLIVFLGIVIGTYSSVFISAPILLYISKDKKKQ